MCAGGKVLLLLSFSWLWLQAYGAKPYLVALTLSGNNKDLIAGALESAVDWVDKVVLLDTGITDSTIDVAEKVAGSKLVVKKMPWPGSFSEARNRALQTAADMGGSWAVFVDTDERFEGETSKIRTFLKTSTADMVNMQESSLTYGKPRFYRLPLRGEYNGPTHEAFSQAPGATSAGITGVVFWEVPKDEEALRRKAQRDVDILTKHTAENPKDARWWYYLGDAYAILGNHEEAIKAFHACTDLRGWDEEGAWAMYRAAQNLVKLERYDDAIDALAKGMTRHAGLPELPWYAGWVSWKAGNNQQAAWWARMATVHGCYRGTCPTRTGFEYPFARYEGPYDTLRWALRGLGDEKGAWKAKESLAKAKAKREAKAGTSKAASEGSSDSKGTTCNGSNGPTCASANVASS